MSDQSDEALVFSILLATAPPDVFLACLVLLEGQCESELSSEDSSSLPV